MAVEVLSSEIFSAAQNVSQELTIPSGTTCVLVWFNGYSPKTVTDVQIDGDAMTLVVSGTGGESQTILYRLVNPSTGSVILSASVSAAFAEGAIWGAIYFSGVDTSDPIRDSATRSAPGTDELDCAAGDYAFVCVGGDLFSGFSGVTAIAELFALNQHGRMGGDAVTSGSTITIGTTTGNYSTQCSCILRVASGGSSYTRTIAEAVGLSDSLSRVALFSRTMQDSAGITDSMFRIAAHARSVLESLGLTDSAARQHSAVRSLADTSDITDTRSRVASYARSLSQSVGISDLLTPLKAVFITISDSIGVSDAMSRAASFFRTRADGIGITDSLSRAVAYVRQTVSSISISDILDAFKPGSIIYRTISDALGITDSASRQAAYQREARDGVSITDVASRAVQFFRGIADSVGISDLLRALKNVFGIIPFILSSLKMRNKYITESIAVQAQQETDRIRTKKSYITDRRRI